MHVKNAPTSAARYRRALLYLGQRAGCGRLEEKTTVRAHRRPIGLFSRYERHAREKDAALWSGISENYTSLCAFSSKSMPWLLSACTATITSCPYWRMAKRSPATAGSMCAIMRLGTRPKREGHSQRTLRENDPSAGFSRRKKERYDRQRGCVHRAECKPIFQPYESDRDWKFAQSSFLRMRPRPSQTNSSRCDAEE
jgi:hypothetical protein